MADQDPELIWAAGLFCADGHTGARTRPDKNGRVAVSVGIAMNDERAVKRFAAAISPYVGERKGGWHSMVGLEAQQFVTSKDVVAWRAVVNDGPAIPVMEALLPHLVGTDKGDQMEAALELWRKRKVETDLTEGS